MKVKYGLLIFGLIIAVSLLVGGCGKITTSVSYYNPSWLPNGRIICTKYVNDVEWSWFGPYQKDLSQRYYITTMNSDGSDERDERQTTSAIIDGEIAASPDGEYIAITAGKSIKVYNSDYSDYSTITPSDNETILHLDFSPISEGHKIVYSNYVRKMKLTDINSSFDATIADSAEAVAWRLGEKIVYEGIVDGLYFYLFSINQDGSNNNQIISGTDPQKFNDSKIVYSGTANVVKSIYLTGTGEATISNNFNRSTLKLSFDNTKIIGGDLDQSDIVGIWVVNIDGTGEERLR